jgi:hypothetical protein
MLRYRSNLPVNATGGDRISRINASFCQKLAIRSNSKIVFEVNFYESFKRSSDSASEQAAAPL